MKIYLYTAVGMYVRNLQILSRQKQLIVAPILLPLILMFLTAVIMGAGGDQWPVGLVDEANNAESKSLVRSIEQSHSNITKYYNVVERDLEKARAKVREGRLQLLIRIPSDYAKSKDVYIETFNINSDMMKNVRLRLEHSILDELALNGDLSVVPKLITEKPHDVWRVSYIAGSCLLLSLFMGATITAGNLHAFENENRTKKELLLTPQPLWLAGLGNVAAAVTTAVICSIPSLLLAVFAFKMKIYPLPLLQVYLMMIPVMIACACAGLWLAHVLKNYRVLQPTVIVLSIATFFGTGGFIGVSVLPEASQTFARYWIVSRVFQWFNPLLHNFKAGFAAEQAVSITAVAAIGLALIPVLYRLTGKKSFSGGQ